MSCPALGARDCTAWCRQVDVLFLDRAAEAQMLKVGRRVFMERLEAAFAFLEVCDLTQGDLMNIMYWMMPALSLGRKTSRFWLHCCHYDLERLVLSLRLLGASRLLHVPNFHLHLQEQQGEDAVGY